MYLKSFGIISLDLLKLIDGMFGHYRCKIIAQLRRRSERPEPDKVVTLKNSPILESTTFKLQVLE